MGKLSNSAKNIGVLAGVLVLGMAIPTLATSNSLGEQITVCVDWNTKQVTYSKFWERCPSKTTPVQLGAVGPSGPQGEVGPQGPAGPAGARGQRGAEGTSSDNSYPWGSQGSCYQKLQAALNSGYRMMYRYERETFETDTGCVVEEIRDEQTISQYRDAGLPVITDWEFVGLDGTGGGSQFWFEDDYFPNTLMFTSVFRITLSNYDSASGWLNQAGFCSNSPGDNEIQYLGNGQYLGSFQTHAGVENLSTDISLGFLSLGQCYDFGEAMSRGLSVKIYEDPADTQNRLVEHDSETIREDFTKLYELWGW
jgi:hypothetical protein